MYVLRKEQRGGAAIAMSLRSSMGARGLFIIQGVREHVLQENK